MEGKNVLILFAMTPSSPAYRPITDGIRTKLAEAYGDAVNLHTEYLEVERYPRGEYPKSTFDLYNRKYEDVKLDLLICVGIGIVDPVKKNASEHILALPNIVIDFDLSDYGLGSDVKLNDRTAAIGLKLKVTETLNAALSLFPDRHSIYFICGTSKPDLLYLKATREASKNFDKSNKYEFITDISMDEALHLVRQLSDSSLIFVPGFNTDSKGVPYYNHESMRLISQAAVAPVFGYTDIGFGDGTVGGYVLSFRKIGLLAGDMAVKLLQGADPSSIIVTENETHDYVLDWRQLKKWHLDGSRLIPRGSYIMFKEENFLEKYRLIIIIAILFILAQTLMIINLVRLYRRQRIMTSQLVESENKFRDLVSEDRILRLSQLTASLSHELNQPLTAILSTAQAGIRFVDSNNLDPELIRELFGNIAEDDKRAAAILGSIRGMMKLEKREKEKVNPNLLVDEIVDIFQSEFIKHNIILDKFLSDQQVYIIADAVQIKQVIMNLLMNAIQSVSKIGLKNRQIIVSEEVRENLVTISISDSGEGISEDIRDKIFKPFVTSKHKGTGIGLAISRTIIEEHQGRIWAENIPGGGAIFAFSLKIC